MNLTDYKSGDILRTGYEILKYELSLNEKELPQNRNDINLIEKRKNFFFTIKYWRESPIYKSSKENYLQVKVQAERTAGRMET